ncbi:MAG TPA: MFS transporter [Candidatus Saccharimonadales bacterium]|nr:MFS transporter [Candidatus Saccharimonadales bacterium]
MNEIRKIYFAHFFEGLSTAASVTFTLYFLSHGLTQAQIGQLFGFFMICLALFDIPTGGLADMFGHKASVGAGLFLQSLSFLLFFVYPTYFGFLLGMLAGALGLAFQSGATSSLIYELLHKQKMHEDFQKVIGRAGGYFSIATIIASPIGSIIYKHNPGLPYLLAFLVFIPATILVYLIKWEFVKKPPKFSTYIKTIKEGTLLTVRNRTLMAITIIGFALTVSRLVYSQNISQPYMVSVGVDVAYIGVIAAIIGAVLAFVSINAYKVSQKIGKTYSLLLIVTIPSITLIALSHINTLLALPVILVLSMGHAFRDPVMAHITQDELDRDKRSTMASTTSFLIGISGGISLLFWGKGIDIFGMQNTLLLLGLFTLVVGTLGLLLFQHKNVLTK